MVLEVATKTENGLGQHHTHNQNPNFDAQLRANSTIESDCLAVDLNLEFWRAFLPVWAHSFQNQQS